MGALLKSRNLEHLYKIVERIEMVRNHFGLSKSMFTRLFGMTPQTYNNFTGPQKSKPSAELLVGVITVFFLEGYREQRLNLAWLLRGEGDMFLADDDVVAQQESGALCKVVTRLQAAEVELQGARRLLSEIEV